MNIETEFATSENQVSTRRKTLLTYDEALDKVLHEVGTQILSNWSTDDLSALLTYIMKYQCEKSGVSIFAKNFENSIEEIMETINKLRSINIKAMKNRYCLTPIDFDSNFPSTSFINNIDESTKNKINFNDWVEAALIINRSRKILDETVVLLPKVLSSVESTVYEKNVQISDSKFVRAYNLLGSPNFNKLYQHLSAIVSARSISKLTSLHAAILLEIFDEIEEEAEKFVKQKDFFHIVFENLKEFELSEFKVDCEINEENIAEITTNVFDFPKELFNLSHYINET